MSGRRQQRKTSFTILAAEVPSPRACRSRPSRVCPEEAPDAGGRVGGPAVSLGTLAIDEVAPRVAETPVPLERRAAAVHPGPPPAGPRDQLGGGDPIRAAPDEEGGAGGGGGAAPERGGPRGPRGGPGTISEGRAPQGRARSAAPQ